MDVSRWVDERLSSLDASGDWRPDSPAAFAKLRRRQAKSRPRWWLWAAISAAAASACAVALLETARPACANPLGCTVSGKPAPAPAPAAVRAEAAPYKQSGAATAPVTCELFSDYECPHCAVFHLDTLPRFTARYVDTGRVRIIHRDFPLSQHRYAMLAARYADAAGRSGYYQAVADKLYRTQAVWSADGDIDGQVARVVPAPAMEKVRAQVRSDPSLEESIRADEAAARERHVERTPTLICNGRVIGPNLNFPRVEAQLDALAALR